MRKNREREIHHYPSKRGAFTLTKPAAAVAALLASGLWLAAAPAYAGSSADTGINRTASRGKLPDLRVDANRDGSVDLDGKSDERLEDSQPALFLPNLDDDAKRCAPGEDLYNDSLIDLNYDPEVDRRLLACNDAQDDMVNGSRDEQDLARIHALPMPDVVDQATVVVSGAPAGAVRLFIRDGGQLRAFDPATEKVPVQALRTGLELRLEGRDIVRDNTWDGSVRVELNLPNGAADSVRLSVAPLLLQNTLQHSQRVLLNSAPKPVSQERFLELYKDSPDYPYEAYLENLKSISVGYPQFRNTLNAARRSAGLKQGLKELNSKGDRWTQDLFEPAYASVPGVDGKPQVMRILIRSAQPWRSSGRVAFTLRGPDVGVVQQFATDLPAAVDQSLNSLGNLDAVPRHSAHGVRYPNGRLLLGSDETRQPDPSFAAMLAAQKAQPLLTVDTSWLVIGHVDEIVQVVPARNQRGWTLAVPDPRGAIALLRDAAAKGAGASKFFVSLPGDPFDGLGLEPSIDTLLANTGFIDDNEHAAQILDRVLAKLLADLDLSERELVKLPVLYRSINTNPESSSASKLSSDNGNLLNQGLLGQNSFSQNFMLNQLQAGTGPQASFGAFKADAGSPLRYYTYSPNLANGLLLSSAPVGKDLEGFADTLSGGSRPDWVFAYTRPSGPAVNGQDIFAKAAINAFARVGVRPFEIEAWIWAHMGAGEVHCTTNVLRDVRPDAAWWRKRN